MHGIYTEKTKGVASCVSTLIYNCNKKSTRSHKEKGSPPKPKIETKTMLLSNKKTQYSDHSEKILYSSSPQAPYKAKWYILPSVPKASH